MNSDSENNFSISEESQPKIEFSGIIRLPLKNYYLKNKQEEAKESGWTSEEDRILLSCAVCGKKPKFQGLRLLIPNKTIRQCRQRWNTVLNPDINKERWRREEDEILFQNLSKYQLQWSKMVPHFDKRTSNAIKNRFYCVLRSIIRRYACIGLRRLKKKSKLEVLIDKSVNLKKIFSNYSIYNDQILQNEFTLRDIILPLLEKKKKQLPIPSQSSKRKKTQKENSLKVTILKIKNEEKNESIENKSTSGNENTGKFFFSKTFKDKEQKLANNNQVQSDQENQNIQFSPDYPCLIAGCTTFSRN